MMGSECLLGVIPRNQCWKRRITDKRDTIANLEESLIFSGQGSLMDITTRLLSPQKPVSWENWRFLSCGIEFRDRRPNTVTVSMNFQFKNL